VHTLQTSCRRFRGQPRQAPRSRFVASDEPTASAKLDGVQSAAPRKAGRARPSNGLPRGIREGLLLPRRHEVMTRWEKPPSKFVDR
jgi:hypothetical protein